MPTADPWADPKTWITAISVCVAIVALIYTTFSNHRNRHVSRLDALAKVLQPLMRAAQHLYKANQTRQKCEKLRVAFPDAETAREAQIHLQRFMAEYSESITESEREFRLAESEFAARSFRFPDKITQLTQQAFVPLVEFGKAVNDGHFSNADLAFVKFKDRFKSISDAGRGWRLADPFEGLRERFKKAKPENTANPFDLSEKEMQAILDLVNKRAMGQARNSFAVHPPKKLLNRPEIATSDRVIEELEDSVFVIVFQDGTHRMLSLVELMVFNYDLLMIKTSSMNVAAMLQNTPQGQSETQIKVEYHFVMDDIMRPAMVSHLLSMIEFSQIASDDVESKDDDTDD